MLNVKLGGMGRMPARLRREERGQNLVELALILPMVLLLIFGVIEFARAYNYSDQTSQVANETARWIIVDQLPAYTNELGAAIPANANPSLAQYRSFAFARLVTTGLRSSTPLANIHICSVALSPTPGQPIPGQPVSVLINTSFATVAAGIVGVSNISLKGKASMRIEAPPGSNSIGTFEGAASC